MDINRWEEFKRSGGYRRKVQNEMNNILNSHGDTTPENNEEEAGNILANIIAIFLIILKLIAI